MATPSNELALGSACPQLRLVSVDGKSYALSDFDKSKGLLIAFICNHCPYVKAIEDRLLEIARAFPLQQLQVVGICSNDPKAYPEDAPAALLARWQEKNYGFPYLIDASQEVAKAFSAACTPDLFLYDKSRKLYYHGRLDDSWKEPAKVTKEELKDAIAALVRGDTAPMPQMNAIGCSIKWVS